MSQLPSGLPAPGEVIANKYRVERVLGIGGMGAVVAAMHLHLDERVAIKLLLPELASDPDLVARFVREGRAAIKIRGEHVARVLDVGALDNGTPFLVMEHLEGADLDRIVGEQGPQTVVTVVDWLLQACEALAEAHGRGLVHRDLKPANLFLTRAPDGGPCIKVLDFGISKIIAGEGADTGLTKTNTTLGSPRYMAPEQTRSDRNVDARTDVWALGAIAYELLTGAPAFDAESLPALVAKVLLDDPKPVGASRPDVPPAFDDIVVRCLAKSPNARFASVAELALALAPFGDTNARAAAERVGRILATAQGRESRASSPSFGAPPSAVSSSVPRSDAVVVPVAQSQSQSDAVRSLPPRAGAPSTPAWGATMATSGGGRRVALVAVSAFGIGIVAFGIGLAFRSGAPVGASVAAQPSGRVAVSVPMKEAPSMATPSALPSNEARVAVPSSAANADSGASPVASASAAPPSRAPSHAGRPTSESRANHGASGGAPQGGGLFDDRK